MRVKALQKNQAVSLEIKIDSSFRGILRGVANDESEGCTLTGQVVMTVTQSTKIRRLETTFAGHLEVEFMATNSMGMPTMDGKEKRSIFKRYIVHFEKQSEYHCGTYCFPFVFSIPAAAPQSFNGKHGSIRYEVTANAFRTSFNSDIHTAHPITLRRCRMNNLDPVVPFTQTVKGSMYPKIVSYSATAPAMVCCEGGLLELNLQIKLKDPSRYRVRVVTCGLQEIIYYRTTGTRSLTNQVNRHDEITYPLGHSTFFPSRNSENDHTKSQDYNAYFRLYPKVNTDNRSSLIVVQHAMFIRILIDDTTITTKKKNFRVSTVKSFISSLSKSEESQLGKQNIPEFGPNNIEESLDNIPDPQRRDEAHEDQEEDININDTRNSSISSHYNGETIEISAYSTTNTEHPLSSPPEQLEYQQPSTVSSKKGQSYRYPNDTPEPGVVVNSPDTENRSSSSRGHRLDQTATIHEHSKSPNLLSHLLSENGVYECHLTIPVAVTSREEYDEGNVPAIPDYEYVIHQQDPPTYQASIERLPQAPIYINNSVTSSS